MIDYDTVHDTLMIPSVYDKIEKVMGELNKRARLNQKHVRDGIGKGNNWVVFEEVVIESLRDYGGEENCGIHPESCDLSENMDDDDFMRLQDWAYDVFFYRHFFQWM